MKNAWRAENVLAWPHECGQNIAERKQGRIHGPSATSYGRVGRGGYARFPTFRLSPLRTNRPTNQRIDKASYRVVCPQLKILLKSQATYIDTRCQITVFSKRVNQNHTKPTMMIRRLRLESQLFTRRCRRLRQRKTWKVQNDWFQLRSMDAQNTKKAP